jgi:SHS2 domain-containing protein
VVEQAGYRVLPHPADIGLEFWGPTRDAALQQAALGLAHLVGSREAEPSERVSFDLIGEDDVERLFDFLSQLVYYMDAERLALTRFAFRPQPGGAIAVEAEGARFEPTSDERAYDVKAVTYHQMALGQEGGAWHGRVYFDI